MASPRVSIQPQMFEWALNQGSVSAQDVSDKIPKFDSWILGHVQPTLKQLEKFSKIVRVPLGYLFLNEPPQTEEFLPAFRTMGNDPVLEMSPELRETLLINQARQQWLLDYGERIGIEPVALIGSISPFSSVEETAMSITKLLQLDLASRPRDPNECLRRLISRTEDLGIVVIKNGVVRDNTHRPLDPQEFRGFALAHNIAPLIFVNAADTTAAQIFTLCHEIVHLAINHGGLVSSSPFDRTEVTDIELWVNKVVGEILVPKQDLIRHFNSDEEVIHELDRLKKRYSCSPVAIAHRLFDADLISWEAMHAVMDQLEIRWRDRVPATGGGGDYYKTKAYRTSRLFTEVVLADTRNSNTPLDVALDLLEMKSVNRLERLAQELGL